MINIYTDYVNSIAQKPSWNGPVRKSRIRKQKLSLEIFLYLAWPAILELWDSCWNLWTIFMKQDVDIWEPYILKAQDRKTPIYTLSKFSCNHVKCVFRIQPPILLVRLKDRHILVRFAHHCKHLITKILCKYPVRRW